MAYCEKCGAYIPDGQTKCLACGYDPAAQEAAYQAAAAAQKQEDEARRAEERRRQRQEEYRQRAEAEFARRQQEKQEQERQAEERSAGHPYSETGRVPHYDYGYDAAPQRGQAKQNKLLAAASYLGILCILPYIFCPEDRFARFHAKQGMVLLLFDVLTSVLGGLTGIGWLLSLFSIFCVFKGFFGALGGRMEALPLIGRFANRIG